MAQMANWDIIKEWTGHTVVVRSNSYGCSLAYFDKLFAAAKEDFPALTRDAVEVHHYGGRSYKYTFGIEFQNTWAPETYQKISKVEDTL